MENRCKQYLEELKELENQPVENEGEKVALAAHTFLKSVIGCNVNLVYTSISKMILSILIGHVQGGAQRIWINGFKLLLDKQYKQLKDGGG